MNRIIILAFVCVVVVDSTRAQEAVKKEVKDQEELRAARLTYMKKSVEPVEIAIGSDRPTQLVLVDEPIQRWSNPVVQITDAVVFVWTDNSRPAVVAQVAETSGGILWQEFQSLASSPLEARHGEQRFWAPTDAGIEWIAAPNAPTPAEMKFARLVQMRRIARKFEVWDEFEFTEPNKLRLLSKPLYRYSAAKAGVLDGAIFSFAVGTDPEVLLLIEARTVGDTHTWKIGFARMTGFACTVKLKGKVIWSREAAPWPRLLDSTFMTYGPSPRFQER